MNSLYCCCCYGIITESLYGKQRFGDGKISIPSPKWHSRWLLVHPSNSFGPVPAHTPSPRLPSPDFQIIVHFYFCLMLAVEWPSALYSPPSIVESRPVVPRSRRRSFSRPRFLPPRFFLRAFPAPAETGSKFSSLRFSLAKRKPRISAGSRPCWSSAAWCSASSTTRGTGESFFTFFLSFFLWNLKFAEILFVLLLLNDECHSLVGLFLFLRYAYVFKCFVKLIIIKYIRSVKPVHFVYCFHRSMNFHIFCFSFWLFLRAVFFFIIILILSVNN